MNLDGKYIEINENNIKPILIYLENCGYYWGNKTNPYTIEYILERYYGSENVAIVIQTDNLPDNKRLFLGAYINHCKKKIDITKLMREVKLKRILK